MTLKRYFASAALLLMCVRGLCCVPYDYLPQEYYMYRAYDRGDERLSSSEYSQNCRAWQAVTSRSVPIEDIRQVVYKYDVDKVRQIMNGSWDHNAFAEWIRKNNDQEVLDFLILAKSCEKVRQERSSRWYYPSKHDAVLMNLESIRDVALAYDGKRLRDRYALQAVRAMHSLGEYERIERWWDENESGIRPGIIRDMAEGYVAGALYRMGKYEKALNYTVRSQDIGFIAAALHNSGRDADDLSVLEFIAEHCPDNPNVPEFLQKKFHGAEDHHDGIEEYVRPCLKVAESPDCKSPAVWYYTAAYIQDLLGQTRDAYVNVKKAGASEGIAFVNESVKVLRIYLEAKMLRYDGSDDARFLSNLRWMDKMLCGNITTEVREKTAEIWRLGVNQSYYYWGDMMRKIVLGEMVPRMQTAGRGRTAIALANVADNRLLGLVDTYTTHQVGGRYSSELQSFTMHEFRHIGILENIYDYRNGFFELMDSIKVRHLEAYVGTVGRASSSLDRFLDARGYVDMDYLNELLGTRYLRAMDYVNAVRILSKVSPGYQYRTNLVSYMGRLPFEYDHRKSTVQNEYKLSFAKSMRDYQKQAESSDPDRAGLAMVMMGLGIRSSFGYCWTLTQYHLYYKDDWLESDYTSKARARAEKLIRTGLAKIHDRELAAKCCVMLKEFKRAVTEFPETMAADFVRTRCDSYKDYNFGLPNKILCH